MTALRRLAPEIKFLGRGGPRMKEIAGADFHDWSEASSVLGLWEVLRHYPYFRKQFRATLEEIRRVKPDATVLIDYPGFNLRLARRLRHHSLGGKIIYYISPQVWAWNRARIPKMARWLDLMLCIFPFEAELYKRSGLRTIFVGHPMIKNLEAKRIAAPRESNLIGIFPGSRAREVRKLMPILLEVMRLLRARRPELRFEIAAASDQLANMIRRELQARDDLLARTEVMVGQAGQTMQRSAAGVVASGTATLEAAFFRMPFVLIYKVAALTYLAGRMVIRVRHLGMPNVLAEREILPEFIQGNARPDAIANEVLRLLDDPARREKMSADFESVIAKLGRGDASETAARIIRDEIS